jgi:hypothetical protein
VSFYMSFHVRGARWDLRVGSGPVACPRIGGGGNYIYAWPPLNFTCDVRRVGGTEILIYQLFKVFPAFMQTIILLSCFQGSVTEPKLKPVESSFCLLCINVFLS